MTAKLTLSEEELKQAVADYARKAGFDPINGTAKVQLESTHPDHTFSASVLVQVQVPR